MFPNETFEVIGVSVASGVSDHPMSDEETFTGAINRMNAASLEVSDADFWVGIEGGIEERQGEMATIAWILVKSRDGRIGKGRTGTFFLPTAIAEHVRNGVELGLADDLVFGRTNSKQGNGAVGILTDDVIDRTRYYTDAVVFALIPFKNESLF